MSQAEPSLPEGVELPTSCPFGVGSQGRQATLDSTANRSPFNTVAGREPTPRPPRLRVSNRHPELRATAWLNGVARSSPAGLNTLRSFMPKDRQAAPRGTTRALRRGEAQVDHTPCPPPLLGHLEEAPPQRFANPLVCGGARSREPTTVAWARPLPASTNHRPRRKVPTVV